MIKDLGVAIEEKRGVFKEGVRCSGGVLFGVRLPPRRPGRRYQSQGITGVHEEGDAVEY